MQNKGAIKFFAIAFAIVCLYQLSFTVTTKIIEGKAARYAKNEIFYKDVKELSNNHAARELVVIDSIAESKKNHYLDSISNKTALNILIRKYTYKECKDREINLGLDLKGGMNVMLEVSIADVIDGMSGHSDDPTYVEAMRRANEKQKNSQKDFVTLFGESFTEVDPNAQLSAIFSRMDLREKIQPSSTNAEVLSVLREEANSAFDRTFNIMRNRIDRFGVSQPTIQKLVTSDRILIELPGIKDPERVRKLLQGSANLEFWETFHFNEIQNYFSEANELLAMSLSAEDIEHLGDTLGQATGKDVQQETLETEETETTTAIEEDTTKKSTSALSDLLEADSLNVDNAAQLEEYRKKNPLFAYLQPAYFFQNGQYYASDRATVGYAQLKDTAIVNSMLKKVKDIFPKNLKLAWAVKPERHSPDVLELFALKSNNREYTAAMLGDVIVDARQDYDQNGRVEVSMTMNAVGAKEWRNLTRDNVGNQIAIVLDDFVYSAPNVNTEIPNGRSSISGNFTVEEAKDLANILKAGKLPAPARIVQEEIVGPSLGQESINKGMFSFLIAFLLVLTYMAVYYGTAGRVADVALLTNVFFLLGFLASLGAVLTLPGIAGIVLTLGMAVDANVIIYERVREEVRAGKGLRLAIQDGYKNAYSAIIDGNVTTLITGIILYIFGSGPIQGFATTLIIGLITSLFTSIFISRLQFERLLNKNKNITFGNKYTINAFSNTKIDFIKLRKVTYLISAGLILISVISLATKGLSFGVDFTGGRSYIVRFDKDVNSNDVREAIYNVLEDAPEVKTFGSSNQVKVTTKYLVDDKSQKADSIVEAKLYEGLKGMFNENISANDFSTNNQQIGILSSQKVDPAISDDLSQAAIYAVLFALLAIFLYIAVRFKNWQFGLGGVASLFHDAILMVALYSIFYGVLPFNLEADQSFIAAILTIIGYSINDAVVVFDRIREWKKLYPKMSLYDSMNGAVNTTLGRTINTAGTTTVTLLAIFIFGGDVIRGFVFAMLIGVLVGTYSTLFTAVPIAYDTIIANNKRLERKKAAKAAKADKRKK